jgi:signal transduction histidine kinase/CheY-like chemotaxis protein/PAS domain-containing protein
VFRQNEANRRPSDSMSSVPNDPLHTDEDLLRALLRIVLDSTADGIMITTEDGRVLDCNQRFVEMWDLPRAAVVNRAHTEMLKDLAPRFRDAALVDARVASLYADASQEALHSLELADGRVFERLTRPLLRDGRMLCRVWSYRDVTAHSQIEEAARDEARMLDLLNRTGAAIVSSLDLDTILQAVTDAATELSGAEFGAFFYNTTDASGNAFMLYTLCGAPREAFAEFGQPRATPMFGPTFRGEGPIRLDDVLADPRYGKWAPHHGMPAGHLPVRSYLAVPVSLRGGETIGGLFFGHSQVGMFSERSERLVLGVAAQAAIALDNARLYGESQRVAAEREQLIADERAARAELDGAGRAKDEFLATLSHELRTPLTAILGWAKVLLSKKGDPALLERGLETIERNAVAQARLIEDLLDMNGIASGKVRLDVKQIDFLKVVDAALEAIRPSADAKGLHLRVLLNSQGVVVSGDPNRLQQVVWNLLVNAVKFTPRGGRIDVALQRRGPTLELTVIDSGIGIAADFLPHVFDRFRQADSSTTRDHGGLGLGLSIVKQLVELHGGTVSVQSAGAGQGATFIVDLPIVAEETAKETTDGTSTLATPAGAAPEIDLQGLKVLVVDDEPDARELMRQLLDDCHAEVLTAPSAAEAMALLQLKRPDLLLSDIGMPERDGYQLIQDVRRLPADRGGHTPAIALTAFARAEDRVRAMQAGYQQHLSKPIEPRELIAAVARLASPRRRTEP